MGDQEKSLFFILEGYDHLKRQLGETIQHFSSRFNQVYHSMPDDIKPPPSLALLHYLDAFDLEMEFHLRERNSTTLEEMQSSAIGVEANLLIKNSKLKVEEKESMKKEHQTSSEVKLNILASTMKEMMRNIIIRNELVVQKHHVPLVFEEERVTVPKHFVVNSSYNRSKNDYFMYSLHAMDKDETQNQFVEGQSTDLMCMLDDFSFMDELPKYDQCNDDYIKVVSSKQLTTCFWEKET
jgi:hypothetical protein